MKQKIYKLFHRFISLRTASKFLILLSVFGIILFFITLISIFHFQNGSLNPKKLISLIIFDLIVILSFIVIGTRRMFSVFSENYKSSKLRTRIVTMFCLVAAIPVIAVSVFSVIFFNLGIQSWFDDKVSTSINTSVKVAELYIEEQRMQLKESAKSIAYDLEKFFYTESAIHNTEFFNEIMDAQAEMRGFTEGIVFQKATNRILAQTRMSFSLMFSSIPISTIEKVDIDKAIEIETDPTKIRVIIKLPEPFYDTYMVIGKIIDQEIIEYVNQTNGAAAEYINLHKEISKMQITFAMVFAMLSIILLGATIVAGAIFGNQITNPILKLVSATELVEKGDFTVRIKIKPRKNDELEILTNAFNRMIKKIDLQQRDLVLAQRSMAWSDVARRVAHEIKNPLTPILLSADRLNKKFQHQVDDQETFVKYTSAILRHTNDIKRIVSEFTNFAKMPSPIMEICNIIELVRDIVESRQIINDKYCYIFATNVSHFDFNCDKTQINQVMTNLCKNAEESLDNIDGTKEISIEIKVMQEEFEVTVSDTGSGFPDELIEKATEPYFTTRSRGSGLGLAIVKKIVQDHSGQVLISNNEQGGGVVKLIFERMDVTK